MQRPNACGAEGAPSASGGPAKRPDPPLAPARRCAREYLTGFRKRKQQRRKEAFKKLEKQQKRQRLEERAEVSEAGGICAAGRPGAQVPAVAQGAGLDGRRAGGPRSAAGGRERAEARTADRRVAVDLCCGYRAGCRAGCCAPPAGRQEHRGRALPPPAYPSCQPVHNNTPTIYFTSPHCVPPSARLQRRQAMKEQMRQQLGIDPDGRASSSGGEGEEEGEEDVKVFHSGQLTSTVTVTAIHTHSDRWGSGVHGLVHGTWVAGIGGPAGGLRSQVGRQERVGRRSVLNRMVFGLGAAERWRCPGARCSGRVVPYECRTTLATPSSVPPSCSEQEERGAGSDGEGGSGDEGGSDGGGGGAERGGPRQRQRPRDVQEAGAGAGGGAGGKAYKMSKHALRVMAKTKMKLDGKKGRGTQAGFAKNLASKKKFKALKAKKK